VDYAAKWESGSMQFARTPRRFDFPNRDRELLERLGELAQRCWRLFELRGYARVDFRVDLEGQPWVLEVNTNPCLSPDAGFLAAAGQAGLSPTEVIRRIVEGART
jgi:D-alanine-D-alanine ligase